MCRHLQQPADFRDIWISPVVIFHTAHGKISPTFPHKCFLCLVIDIYLEIFTDILPIIPNEIRGVIPAFSSMNIIVYPDLETIRQSFTSFTLSVLASLRPSHSQNSSFVLRIGIL